MKKRVVVINTFLYSVEDLKKLFAEIVPEVELINVVDESLLREVLANDQPSIGVIRRICLYAQQAEAMGADLILNQCSSVSEVVDIASKMISIPFLKIDEPMAEIAVTTGNRIGVVATAKSTMGPSSRLVATTARKLNRNVKVNICFAEGAYDALLLEQDKEKHDKILMRTIEKACEENDIVVLAQGSMMSLLDKTKDMKVPVICSFRTGVEQVRKVLKMQS